MESLLLLILCGFAAAFLIATTKLGQTAAMFPRLVAEATLFAFVIGLVLRLLSRSAPATKRPPAATTFGAAVTLQAGYVVMIVLTGFPIATLMYLLACPRLMGYQRWKILFAYAGLLTSAVFLAFAYVLHVRFPRGLLWG